MGDGVTEVLATNGDTHLGGDDFDQRIIDWMADAFQTENGIDLRKEGFDVTQATISRDIRELCLVKAATAEGYRYVSSRNESFNPKTQGRFETIFHESVLGVDYAGHVVLVKCYSGMANAACEVFDALQWKNVVGTLSGDDTFLIVARSERDAKTICTELTRHIG